MELEVFKGDITTLDVDAIVNAANESLLGGGGVDGAIHRAAGPELLEATKKIGGCPTGEARITEGYNLPAKYVIHTVGPIYGKHDGRESELLRSCYAESLKLASEYNCKSIAFSAISTGVYSFPAEEATEIAIKTVLDEIKKYKEIEKVIFVCFSDEMEELYLTKLKELMNENGNSID